MEVCGRARLHAPAVIWLSPSGMPGRTVKTAPAQPRTTLCPQATRSILTSRENRPAPALDRQFKSGRSRFCWRTARCRRERPTIHHGGTEPRRKPGSLFFSMLPVGSSDYFPVPCSVTFCGEPPPLSLMARVALRVPVAVGVEVTGVVQPWAPHRFFPQLFPWFESAPLTPGISEGENGRVGRAPFVSPLAAGA